jgi:hypothetical protein
MMYFLNGLLCGFITGITVGALQTDPMLGVMKHYLNTVRVGWMLGALAGTGAFVWIVATIIGNL